MKKKYIYSELVLKAEKKESIKSLTTLLHNAFKKKRFKGSILLQLSIIL